MTTQDTQSRLVQTIDDVRLIAFPLPPTGRFIVLAIGTANSSAWNARLVPSDRPALADNLMLDLVADHGMATVMTPVCAPAIFDLGGYRTVTVAGAENEKSVEVPKQSRPEAAKAAAEDFSRRQWRATHFLNHKAAPEPVIPGSRLTAYFSDSISGTVTGSGGCNVYGASFVWQPTASINIYDLVHTQMYCEGLMEQERRFFSYLLEAREMERKGEVLELRSGPPGASTGIRFDLAKPE